MHARFFMWKPPPVEKHLTVQNVARPSPRLKIQTILQYKMLPDSAPVGGYTSVYRGGLLSAPSPPLNTSGRPLSVVRSSPTPPPLGSFVQQRLQVRGRQGGSEVGDMSGNVLMGALFDERVT